MLWPSRQDGRRQLGGDSQGSLPRSRPVRASSRAPTSVKSASSTVLFHELARKNTDQVCAMNLAQIEGVARGLHLPRFIPSLEPKDGMWCVAFHVSG